LAQRLLALYAQREVGAGFAFPVDDELQQAMSASAAHRLLEDALQRLPPESAFAEVAEFLPLAEWECIGWPLDGSPALRWAGRPDLSRLSADPLPTAKVVHCLQTFGRDRQRMVDACVNCFSDMPADEIADKLLKLLEASEDLGKAMFGLDVASMPESERLAVRGW